MTNLSKLYLLPNLLGEGIPERVLPPYVLQIIDVLNVFVVENEKSARKFIKTILPEKSQPDLVFFILNKHSDSSEFSFIHKLIYFTFFKALKDIQII